MILSHRIALDPTAAQAAYFRRACGVARFAYNWALKEWTRQYQAGEKPTANSLRTQWNAVRRSDFPWSYEVTKCAGHQAILNLGVAFRHFFNGLKSPKNAGKFKHPKMKRKFRSRDSFYINNDKLAFDGSVVRLPKLGVVRMREAVRFQGKLLRAVVSRTADQWFISVAIEMPDQPTVQHSQESVGIDLGLKHLAVLSHPMQDGTMVFANPRPLRAATVKLRRLHRGCSRQEQVRKKSSSKKSNRAIKRQRQLARAHARVANVRSDALHKMTTALASEFKVVVLENLNNSGLLKNHHLAKSLADASFGEIRRQLTYKTVLRGGHVHAVGRFERSTGVCPDCDYKTPERLPLNIRTWTCPVCAKTWDRDVAAARVIHKIGTACPESEAATQLLTHGETSALAVAKAATKLTSVNREPQRIFRKVHR